MRNSEKLLKVLSDLLENGMLNSKDIRDEIKTDLKFQRDKLINKLQLVSKEEFNVLKKVVEKQDLKIRQLTKKKKSKKAKKPYFVTRCIYFYLTEYFPRGNLLCLPL